MSEPRPEELRILRVVAHLLSDDPYRFPSDRKSTHDCDILTALVVSEVLKLKISDDPYALVAALKKKGITLKPSQVRDYFRGRFTPGSGIVGNIANRFKIPEIRILSKMPWHLLTDRSLTLKEIRDTLRPDVEFQPSVVAGKTAKKKLWYAHPTFRPGTNWLNVPSEPNEFWEPLATFRAALVHGDFHSLNTYYWSVIANLPSIVTDPAVLPHVERLYTCVRMLTLDVDRQFLWFSVNWNAIRKAIEHRDFGPTSRCKPFCNVFRGNDMHLGDAFPITELHRYLDAHPEVTNVRRPSGSLRTKAT